MGNCSGIFTNCTGENEGAVHRINSDKMKQAQAINEKQRIEGDQFVGMGAGHSVINDNHYN